MTDGLTPAEQDQTPLQQATPPPAQTPPGAPEGYIEKARFDGLVRKVEELTLANRAATEQLALKTSEIEQLKGQLTVKETEKTVAVGERDKLLQDKVQQLSSMEAELAELRGVKLKLEVAKELGRPELMKIIDRIPNLTDKEALKTVMGDFATFADDLVKEREKQLLAGITPPVSQSAAKALPASNQAWEAHVNSLPLGSPERTKAMDDYYTWLSETNQ